MLYVQTLSKMKTPIQIETKIKELVADQDNFVGDNYGTESADNGEYETYFSPTTTEDTLRQFAAWMVSE